MIYLKKIEVRGDSLAGRFSGVLELTTGLQVISAENSYGKSLATKAVMWCLGLEAIFGNAENDPIRLPGAVREEVNLGGHTNSLVVSSEAEVTFEDGERRTLQITRAIKGGDASVVVVHEKGTDGKERVSKLLARRSTMQDAHGGFQRFLFEWLNWPRVPVPTFRQIESEVYLENLAPLFYIDQDEGWTNIQALQISRYGQLEIGEIAVEYLLGAIEALSARISRLRAAQKTAELKDGADILNEQILDRMLRYGWRLAWSSHGSVSDIAERWSKRSLKSTLKEDASVDLPSRRTELTEQIERLRKALTTEPIDPTKSDAPVAASQKAIELKKRRHVLNEELSTFNFQLRETSGLLSSIEHRLQAASDLLRLKTTGVGRLDHLECPTCHRDLDPSLFGLTSQSADSVQAHIEALKSDRELVRRNQEGLSASVATCMAKIEEVDSELRDAERALVTVTDAIGSVREQLAATASELNARERALERLLDAEREIDDFQKSIDRWIADAKAVVRASADRFVDVARLDAFRSALRGYLLALGHSAVDAQSASMVEIDDQYVPFMNGRRLRSLGSASDQSRLVAAYSLALLATAQQMRGKHPGFLIFDEPLQQNPDQTHRELFLDFLTNQAARRSEFQTLIFTWLSDREKTRLLEQGTRVITPPGTHFLKLETVASERAAE